MYEICPYISLSFVKLFFSVIEILIVMWKQLKIIKRIIFILFVLEKIKFEEM